MDAEEDKMKIRKIENGVVIDHVPSGKGPKVLSILGVGEDFPGTVSMVMHTPSPSMGQKDLIKIEGRELADREINKIQLVAPDATVNYIRSYEVVRKQKVEAPDSFEGVVTCPNPRCVSAKEVVPRLLTEQKKPLVVRCYYCEKVYDSAQLLELSTFTS